MRELLLKAVEGLVDEHRVDALGNLICLKKARKTSANPGAPQRVLVAAHMDEVGLIVTGINGDGTLRFAQGWWHRRPHAALQAGAGGRQGCARGDRVPTYPPDWPGRHRKSGRLEPDGHRHRGFQP